MKSERLETTFKKIEESVRLICDLKNQIDCIRNNGCDDELKLAQVEAEFHRVKLESNLALISINTEQLQIVVGRMGGYDSVTSINEMAVR